MQSRPIYNTLQDLVRLKRCRLLLNSSVVAESERAAGNHFESEALPGSLPKGQNNPRVGTHDDDCLRG